MTTRKHFLAATAALAAAPQIAAAAPPASAKAAESPMPKLHFDLPAFDAMLDAAVPHKHLFADRKLDGGSGLGAVRSTLNAYRDVGIAPDQVATAMVLYHGPSICIAMDDHVWDTYLLPGMEQMRKTVPAMAKDFESIVASKTKGNPFLKSVSGDASVSVEALASDGLRFFVCNNALMGFSQELAHAAKLSPAAVYADVSSHLVTRSTVVPAGVWAIHYSQDKKYTLLQTS